MAATGQIGERGTVTAEPAEEGGQAGQTYFCHSVSYHSGTGLGKNETSITHSLMASQARWPTTAHPISIWLMGILAGGANISTQRGQALALQRIVAHGIPQHGAPIGARQGTMAVRGGQTLATLPL